MAQFISTYKPQFPYLDNQIILSSNRVLLYSKTDAIFLFGKLAVSLSSPNTINLDATKKVLIDAPKIELGKKAEEDGEPVVKGLELTVILNQLLLQLQNASMLMAQASESDLGASMQAIASAGQIINAESSRLASVLGLTPNTNPILSKTTFTT